MSKHIILRAVFSNGLDKRYRPRSLNGGLGWGVWDGRLERFLEDKEVKKIDPHEMLAPPKVH